MAGHRHGVPRRFFAPQRGAFEKSPEGLPFLSVPRRLLWGVSSILGIIPYPIPLTSRRNRTNNGLPALVDVDVLHRDPLLNFIRPSGVTLEENIYGYFPEPACSTIFRRPAPAERALCRCRAKVLQSVDHAIPSPFPAHWRACDSRQRLASIPRGCWMPPWESPGPRSVAPSRCRLASWETCSLQR
jgi:hypothetical protein